MKNIIFYIPSIEKGGVEKNFYSLINGLKEVKYNIKIVTFNNNKYLSKLKNSKNINIITFSNKTLVSSRIIKFISCFFLLFKELLFTKNIVIAYQSNILAIIASKLTKNKIIIRCNTSTEKYINNSIKKIFFIFFYKFADKIIVNSKEFQNELKKKFSLKSKIILNIIDKRKTIKLSNEKIKYNFFNTKKYLKIINIARLSDQKDQLTLIKAFEILSKKRNARLLIIGDGNKKKKLSQEIKNRNLSKNIKLIGYKKNPLKYLKLADIFVLTSLYEGFPNVLLESICLKKLIISSNCKTGPKELIEQNKGGYLFQIQDYNKLSQILIKLNLNNKPNRDKINYSFKKLNEFSLKNQKKKII